MENAAQPLLACRQVSIQYGNLEAVAEVSFEVEEGDFLCIVGSNGSGKSTLLKGILGLLPIKSGKIQFAPTVKPGQVGYLPQQSAIQRDFPAAVGEVVLSGCLSRKGARPYYNKAEYRLVKENMERLQIAGLRKKSYGQLSGGQQQRVLLARALCATEKLLFLDEPTTGLDPAVTVEFYQLIRDLNRNMGLTVVMTSHDVAAALQVANKVLQLHQRLEFFGDSSQYRQSAALTDLLGGALIAATS